MGFRVLILKSVVLGFALCAIWGCGPSGPPVAAVSGKVTYQGEPVTVGEVIFISDSGYGSSGSLKEDGTFVLVSQHGKGIPPGEYMVAITPPDPDDLPDRGRGMNFDNIPNKYHNFGNSGLSAVVQDGSNVFEFDME